VTTSQHANRLVNETSPYLLQHAHNPVDWYPWGPEALARAQREDKPILLSVGYSACHWCHVMAHESFEDPDTAALMNELFVSVKVDREERPDLDAIYMEAVQAMTGHGGWPMTVFLTPEGKPFYGGTYFPATPRYDMPSFRQLLRAIGDAWRERRRELESAGDRLSDALNRSALIQPTDTPLTPELLDHAARGLLQGYDPRQGGFGSAPKFPQPMNLDFLLQSYRRTGDQTILNAVTLTLRKMAHGGIYDQLGGGFHRYSTDHRWLVPHFEKMLYDNAQLARTYLHAWQVTGEEDFRRIVEETLNYVLREMTSPEGGFYSTQDADSEGREGRFFLWAFAEVVELLGSEEARLFSAYYDITPSGNFHEGGESANILHIEQDLTEMARARGVSPERLAQVIARGRKILFDARERRVHPGRDDKVLAEWNGLMIHAFAEAGAALKRTNYLIAAERAANFVLSTMGIAQSAGLDPDLRLCRTYKDGQAKLNAYLEDYAAMALGLLGLYQATFAARWLEVASALAQTILDRFLDREGGTFFQTSTDHERLVTRRKDFVDSAIPAGNSLAADLFLRLGALSSRADYAEHGAAVMRSMTDTMRKQPAAFGRLLCAADFYLNPGEEIAIVGDLEADETRALLAEVYKRYLPNSVLALRAPDDETLSQRVPLLQGRGLVNGRAAAYVCRNYVCRLPVTDPEALAQQLGRSLALN
jgi:uncharacterized protein YyaL (SSP411 family)